MAHRGLTLAWADRPVALHGARSIGRAVGDLAVELPMCLLEAESALDALVAPDLSSLTDVEPTAALSRALADGLDASATEPTESARPTRVARPVTGGHVDPEPHTGVSSTPHARRHRTTMPAGGSQRLPPSPSGTSETTDPPPWRHFSLAAATTAASPVGPADLVRMASPPHRTTAAAVANRRRERRDPTSAESTREIRGVDGHPVRTSPGTENVRPAGPRRPSLESVDAGDLHPPNTNLSLPRERPVTNDATDATGAVAAAPPGQGLTALVAAWNRSNDGVEPRDRSDAVTPATVAGPFAPLDEARTVTPTDTAVRPEISAAPRSSTGREPVRSSDLDTEALLLEVLASALRTEARRYGIEPDVGAPR